MRADSTIEYFTLEDLLPEEYTLAFNRALGIFSILAKDETTQRPHLIQEQQFSQRELQLLLPVLTWYPQFCPSPVLLANFERQCMDDATVNLFRQRLEEAAYAGVWDYEMRGIRNVMSRVRQKLREFGMDVSAIVEQGYILVPRQYRMRAR